MDAHALQVANMLVGNPASEAAIEMTIRGVEVDFDEDTVVAVCGGKFSVHVDGKLLPMWRPVWVQKGAVVHVGYAGGGCRAYLAVSGTWHIRETLGSKSTNLYAGFGGVAGRALEAGDTIEISHQSKKMPVLHRSACSQHPASRATWPNWHVASSMQSGAGTECVIRVVPGPDFSLLTEDAQTRMYAQSYTVTTAADRMGIQLQSDSLGLCRSEETLSKPVVTGALQRLHSGQLTVLMVDRQTTGGYPVVGVAAGCDLSQLAQVRPGTTIRLQQITHQESLSLRTAAKCALQRLRFAIANQSQGL